MKRTGFLVEALGLAIPDRQETLARWQAIIEPGAGGDGPKATAWQLRINVRGPGSRTRVGRLQGSSGPNSSFSHSCEIMTIIRAMQAKPITLPETYQPDLAAICEPVGWSDNDVLRLAIILRPAPVELHTYLQEDLSGETYRRSFRLPEEGWEQIAAWRELLWLCDVKDRATGCSEISRVVQESPEPAADIVGERPSTAATVRALLAWGMDRIRLHQREASVDPQKDELDTLYEAMSPEQREVGLAVFRRLRSAQNFS